MGTAFVIASSYGFPKVLKYLLDNCPEIDVNERIKVCLFSFVLFFSFLLFSFLFFFFIFLPFLFSSLLSSLLFFSLIFSLLNRQEEHPFIWPVQKVISILLSC